MIDLHLHILPGVDDGALNMEEAFRMAEIALRSGTDRVIATPHCNHPFRAKGFHAEQLKKLFVLFRNELKKRGLPLKVYDGMEIYVDENTGSLIQEGKLFGLNHGKYYLLEFPFDADPAWIDDRLNEIASPDVIPLLAHVERYHCAQRDPGIIYRWLRGGCEIQVNKGSFFGVFGKAAQNTANVAIENGLISCIASDAHDSEGRTPWMRDIKNYLIKNYNKEIASLLLKEYPARILKSLDIPEHGQWPSGRR